MLLSSLLTSTSGNSWLAISQINFASRFSHPAVKALAPWEALTDVYRQNVIRGGVPRVKFLEMILKGFAGIEFAVKK